MCSFEPPGFKVKSLKLVDASPSCDRTKEGPDDSKAGAYDILVETATNHYEDELGMRETKDTPSKKRVGGSLLALFELSQNPCPSSRSGGEWRVSQRQAAVREVVVVLTQFHVK